MWTDPIVDEIHRVRQAQVEKVHCDLWAIYNHSKKHETQHKDRVVSLPIKRFLAKQQDLEVQEV